MYQCMDCKCKTQNLKLYSEYHGEPNMPPEIWYGCPVCGGFCKKIDTQIDFDDREDEDL